MTDERVRRGLVRLLGTLLLCFAQLLFAASAQASPSGNEERAAALFDEGSQAYQARQFAAAALAFEAAYALKPHGATLYNAGLAWRSAERSERAANILALSVRLSGLSPSQTKQAKRTIEELRVDLGEIEVQASSPSRVRFDGFDWGTTPLVLFASPGEQRVLVQSEGGASQEAVVMVRAGERRPLVVEWPKAVVPTSPEQAQPHGSSRRVWGYVTLGGAAVSIGAFAFFGQRGLSARDAFDASNREDRGARQDALRFRTAANVALGAAAVLGGAGLYLVFSGEGSGNGEGAVTAGRPQTRLGVTGDGIVLTGAF